MNRIISLFLFIFIASCLNAQYNSPIRNKVTLGKQTTADGLVWRGRLADTANLLTNKLDTSVYIVLVTGTRAMWYYRVSTTPKWTRLVDSLNNLQGQLSLTTKVTGVLPVANGGTGNTSLNAADIVTKSGTQTIGGAKTFSSALSGTSAAFGGTLQTNVGFGIISGGGGFAFSPSSTRGIIQINGSTDQFLNFGSQSYFANFPSNNLFRMLTNLNDFDFVAGSVVRLFIQGTTGNIGIGTESPTARLHVKGSANASEFALKVDDSGNNNLLSVQNNGDVTLKNPLAVANGGTGSATQNFVDLTTTQNSIAGAKTFTSTVTGARFDPTSSSVNGTGMYLPSSNALGLSSNNVQRMHITSGGSIGFGAIPSAGHDYQVSNIGSDEIVLFVINNIKDNPTTNTIARFDFGVYSNGANYIPSNTIVGQTNYIGQANDASYVAGKIDVTVTNAGNVGRAAGHSGIMRFYTKPTNDNGVSERMIISEIGAVTINNLAGSGSRAVNASSTGVLSASSSILIKENVENINYGLSDVLKLKPVIFNYIDKDKWGEGKELGFIAEDVMDIIPESTGTMNNSDIYFDLQKLIPVLTKAIQEQQGLIKALEQRILILENK
jgi:hypothetical protein